MLLKISIILFAVFVVFLLLYLLSVKKSKKKGFIQKFTGFISLISLLCAVVFLIIFCKANNIKIFNRLKSYDVLEKYTQTLKSSDAQTAYPLLPTEVFAHNEQIYFKNTQNDLFEIQFTEDKYILSTVENGVDNIVSDNTIKATIKDNGDLVLDGYLLYSKYESKFVEFNNKVIAKNVASVSVTSNSVMYITNNGELYALGFNEYGQLGDTTTKNKSEPVFVKDGITKAEISDTHSMIIDKFGTLYAVGDNSYSQLGNKTAVSSTEFTKIMQGVKDIKLGNYLSFVLTVNGELYTAGKNDLGQLGNNGKEFKAELILALKGVEKISIHNNTCAALTYDGKLYVWGDNAENKAGIANKEILISPTEVSNDIYDFALSDKGIIAITKDRNVFITNEKGDKVTVAEFGAQVPDAYKDRFLATHELTDEKV